MAAGVLPFVRLTFVCDAAGYDPAAGKWTLTNPRTVVLLPPGGFFPARVPEFWLYVQLSDVVGDFELAVEMRQVLVDGTRRTIGRGGSIPMEFKEKLLTADNAFRMKNIPFPEPGLYEFCVTVKVGEGSYRVLEGEVAELLVLDRRTTL